MPLALPFKINVPKTETTVNLKSASFVVIMLLHEGLTHIQSQIKPRLLFGESFALRETHREWKEYCAFAFTETWLQDNIADAAIKLEGMTALGG